MRLRPTLFAAMLLLLASPLCALAEPAPAHRPARIAVGGKSLGSVVALLGASFAVENLAP